MSLARNKKGIELETLVIIILTIIAAGLIIAVINYAFSKAEEKTSENLCRGFNALRFGTRVDKGPVTFNVVPRACKTIDRGDLPGKEYKEHVGGIQEGAKAELRDIITKCWWMWLEGKQPNIFDTETLSLQNKCFVCYVFSFQDKVTITIPNFVASLDKPYEAVPPSTSCAPGRGGKCCTSCDKSCYYPNSDYLTKSTPSNKCEIGKKCCISKELKNECINKGGKCSPEEGYRAYDKWSCESGTCYVKEENFISYLDYIQGTGGATGGAGFIVYQDKLNNGLTNQKKYAITLISPGNTLGLDTIAWGSATLLLGGGAIASAIYVPFPFKKIAIEGTALGAYGTYKLTQKSGSLAGYNFIYLSEYDDVRQKCSVEAGVDGAS